ncbi:hypothetical protein GY21_20090 [Cryobacterium roopkundense]|uniref:Uncharacterized protein n=1 Tax=Cryobacterium roopkundense TaxID=1001240 RepID=A0A099J007_9MICO|nr:HEPN domain-containing protein [Cryobacterium roopkundense]KGJ71749.1 hypothetical protein GY21_20090 [Cryobacterium roopkundense]MBB5643707.1 hypothetical protein [Cryobacterium roopkundense]
MSRASIEEIEIAISTWGREAGDYLDSHSNDFTVRDFHSGWEVGKKSEIQETAIVQYIPVRASIEWHRNVTVADELGKLVSWPAAEAAISTLLDDGPSPVQVEGVSIEMTIALVLVLRFVDGFDGSQLKVSVDRDRLPSRVTEVVNFLRSTKRYSTRWVIPLSPDIDGPVELEPNVFVTPLSPEDLAWALNLNVLWPKNYREFAVARSQYQYGALEVLHEGAGGGQIERYERVLELALVLSRTSHVLPVGYFETVRLTPPPSGSLSSSRHGALSRSLPQWTKAEIGVFAKAWHLVQKGSIPKAIDLALRRLARTAERSAPEDTTIDLMIAAEALYLSELGNGELSYRLSTRAGLWLDTSSLGDRVRTKNLFTTAYSVRSKVAHGNTPTSKDLKYDGVAVTLQEINDQVLRVLKLACWKALEASEQGDWPPNWDELIFRQDSPTT